MFFCAKLLFYCTQLRFVQLSNKAYDEAYDDDDEIFREGCQWADEQRTKFWWVPMYIDALKYFRKTKK